jgi:hypothetical protein
LRRLVINVDADAEGSGADAGTCGISVQRVMQIACEFEPNARPGDGSRIQVGATEICLIRWEAQDAPAAGLPARQTLERLVSAAILAAYPKRGPSVQSWLDGRPDPPQDDSPKEHAWSYMAGWYAERHCEAFYATLWDEARIAAELQRRLRDSGAWEIAESLAK